MSFILDALRKSENERQQAAVPGISDVPAVVHRNKIPTWLLGIIVGLTACVVVLGWAWFSRIGTGNQAPVASAITEEPVESVGIPVRSSATSGEVRSLAREVRQPAAAAPSPGLQTPTATAAPQATAAASSGPILTMDQLLSSGTQLPELNLELHVFAASPADRFVFINSSKYQEGESLPEGPRLVAITEEGVVMDHQNQSFLLPRE